MIICECIKNNRTPQGWKPSHCGNQAAWSVCSVEDPTEHVYCEDCLPPGLLESTEFKCVRIEE